MLVSDAFLVRELIYDLRRLQLGEIAKVISHKNDVSVYRCKTRNMN